MRTSNPALVPLMIDSAKDYNTVHLLQRVTI